MNGIKPPRFRSQGLSRLGIRKLAPNEGWEIIQSIQRAESEPTYDTWVRCSLVVVASVALSIHMQTWIYVLWALCYVCAATWYSLMLRRADWPVTSSRYATLCRLYAFSSVVYSILPIVIWVFDYSLIERLCALAAVYGFVIFNLTHRKLLFWPIYLDQIIVLMTIAIVGVQTMQYFASGFEKGIIGFSALAVAIYYVQSHASGVREHVDLIRSRVNVMNDQVDSATGQITAGVAHDFNNILTVVQGNIDLAELTDDPRERSEFLEQARTSTKRASEIVAQLMSYVGKSQLRAKTLGLAKFLDDLHPLMMMVVPNSILLEISRATQDQTVFADSSKLKTALIHLIRNAAEATADYGDGQISVSVDDVNMDELESLSLDGQHKNFVAIRVTDTGPGMPAEMVQRVTEPFFSTKPKGQGSGLGLSMVKGFAKQSGGALVLHNAKSGGLEASLYLPATSGREPENA